jgi:two-component system sensor histidine kinase KdpD
MAVFAGGLSGVIGNVLHVAVLSNPVRGSAGIDDVSAVMFTLIGLTLLRLRESESKPWERLIIGICLSLLLVALKAGGINPEWHLLSSSATFLCLLGALMCSGFQHPQIKRATHLLIILSMLLVTLRLLKYTHGIDLINTIDSSYFDQKVRVESLILMLLAGTSLLCVEYDKGCLGLIASPGSGGQLVRVLLPVVVVVPFLGLLTQPYHHKPAIDLMITLLVILLGFPLLVLDLGRRLDRLDLQRQHAIEISELLCTLAQQLMVVVETAEVLKVVAGELAKLRLCQIVLMVPSGDGYRELAVDGSPGAEALTDRLAAIKECVATREPLAVKVKAGTVETYLHPVLSAQAVIAVIVVSAAESKDLPLSMCSSLSQGVAQEITSTYERISVRSLAEYAVLQADSEQQRAALLSGMSHDLRTPLTAISGAASSFLAAGDKLNPETARELVQSISDEAYRMSRLITNLLQMTRLQAKPTIDSELNSLEEVVGTALKMLEQRLHGHKVVTVLQDDLPLVMMDGLLMEQVLINLIENAIKYSSPASDIILAASVADGQCTIKISNTGSSLASGEEQLIFEPFYQRKEGGQNRGRDRGGVGLGLSVCRAIIKAHKGTIAAENLTGHGVAFVITIPAGVQAVEGEAGLLEEVPT